MRITMILSRLDQTGMTTHTLDLAEALVNKGHEVTVLTGYNKKEPDETSMSLMHRLKSTGALVKTFYTPTHNSAIGLIRSCTSLLVRMLQIKTGGVIHVQSPYLSWAPWLLRRKFISTLHVAALVKCTYYKNATHLIAISKETKDYAKRVFGYNDSDITIVNHGVSPVFAAQYTPEQISEIRQKLHLPTDKLLLTIVGSIEPRKGQDILLKAVAKLPEDCRNKVHIVFLGSDKTEDHQHTQWLKNSIAETGCADMVSHFEYQDSKIFYKISDVFLLPSWVEGFPLVTIEAMLAGDLCIRTDAEGAYEQIIDEETGFIFPKGDADRLTQILETIIKDDSLRLRIALNGRKFALTHFVSDVMAEKTLKVYKKIMP